MEQYELGSFALIQAKRKGYVVCMSDLIAKFSYKAQQSDM